MNFPKIIIGCICFYLLLTFCSASKNKPVKTEETSSSAASSNPSTFKCISEIIEISVGDEHTCDYYDIVLYDVLEKGSALIHQPAPGDSIKLKDCTVNNHFAVQTGDLVQLVIEERIMLNSEEPEYILKTIRKK